MRKLVVVACVLVFLGGCVEVMPSKKCGSTHEAIIKPDPIIPGRVNIYNRYGDKIGHARKDIISGKWRYSRERRFRP